MSRVNRILTAVVFIFIMCVTNAFAQLSNQTITLKTGYNFISFTLKPSGSAAELKNKNAFIDDIYSYNTAAGSFLSVSAGDQISLLAAKGYIIKAKSDAALLLSGEALTQAGDISLKKGFNLVGFSKAPQSDTFSAIMNKYSFISGMYKWNSMASSFVQLVRNVSGIVEKLDSSDPVVMAGQSYFINLAADATLNYDGSSINMASNAPAKYYLSIALSPSQAGTVSVSIAGPYDAGSGVTLAPSAYLGYAFKRWEGTDSVEISNNQIIMNANKSITAVFESIAPATSKSITVDASSELGAFATLMGTHNGPVSLVKKTDETAKYKELGFKAIHTLDYYGPFTWYNMFPDFSKDPELESSYSFASTDAVVKQIIDGGFEILFNFAPSWSDPVYKNTADPPGTVRDSAGNITHQANSEDFKKFANICKHIVMHYNDGWASGFNYNIKKWELWNEPETVDHFWTGSAIQFFQMFGELSKTLKAYNSNLILYGPGNAQMFTNVYTTDFIAYCKANNVALDAYTWHCYGGAGKVPSEAAKYARDIRAMLDANGYQSTISVCDEWNSGLDAENFSDTGKGAAYYGCTLAYFIENSVAESYHYRGDDHPLGMIRESDGAYKKSAYTFMAWKQMTESAKRLKSSTSETGDFTVVASKTTDLSTHYVLVSNFTTENKTIKLDLSNISPVPAGGFVVTRKVISDTQKLSTAETGTLAPASEASYVFEIPSYSVAFIQLTNKN